MGKQQRKYLITRGEKKEREKEKREENLGRNIDRVEAKEEAGDTDAKRRNYRFLTSSFSPGESPFSTRNLLPLSDPSCSICGS